MSLPTCPTCVYAKGICKKTGVEIRTTTGCSYHTPKPIINADRVRAMTDEELANFLWSIGQNPGGWNYIDGKPIFHSGKGNGWLDWLKQEANHND